MAVTVEAGQPTIKQKTLLDPELNSTPLSVKMLKDSCSHPYPNREQLCSEVPLNLISQRDGQGLVMQVITLFIAH